MCALRYSLTSMCALDALQMHIWSKRNPHWRSTEQMRGETLIPCWSDLYSRPFSPVTSRSPACPQNSLNLGYGGGGGAAVGGGGGLQVPGVPLSLKSLLAQRRMPLPAEFDLSPPPGALYSGGGRAPGGGGALSPRGERPPPASLQTRDQRAIEQAAKQHRSAASVYDATCTWSGQLPKRLHRNPVYSCKVTPAL